MGRCPTWWQPYRMQVVPSFQRRKLWLTPTTRVPFSKAAKTRNGYVNVIEYICSSSSWIITFYVSRRRREMHIGHARLQCVSVCPSSHAHNTLTQIITYRGHGRGCPLVVHYWVDLQSVHMTTYRAANAKCQGVIVLAVCLVWHVDHP